MEPAAAEELLHQGGTFGAILLFGTPSSQPCWGAPGELPPPCSEGLSTPKKKKKIQPLNRLSASNLSGWFISKISVNQMFPLHLLCPDQRVALGAAVLSPSGPQSSCLFGLVGAVQHRGCVWGFPVIWGPSSGTAPGSRVREGCDVMSVHVLLRSLPYPKVKLYFFSPQILKLFTPICACPGG